MYVVSEVQRCNVVPCHVGLAMSEEMSCRRTMQCLTNNWWSWASELMLCYQTYEYKFRFISYMYSINYIFDWVFLM